MIFLSDKYLCDCKHEFEWRTFDTEDEKYVNVNWDRDQYNVLYKFKTENGYCVTIQCPKCYKRHIVDKEF